MSHKIPANSPDATTNIGKLDVGYELDPGDATVQIRDGNVILSKATAAAITLPAPTAGLPTASVPGDDGKTLRIVSTTAAPHVVTCPVGFNGKNASGTATFAAAKGSGVILIAQNGQWYVVASTGATLA